MTTNVNRLSLSIDSSNIIKYSLITRENYMSYGRYLVCFNNNTLESNNLNTDIDIIASVPTDNLLSFKDSSGTNLFTNVKINVVVPPPR
jgi:hypothetical protein